MQSFKSREFIRETFAWEHYYWYLTNDGIEQLRTYLNLPSEMVLAPLRAHFRNLTHCYVRRLLRLRTEDNFGS